MICTRCLTRQAVSRRTPTTLNTTTTPVRALSTTPRLNSTPTTTESSTTATPRTASGSPAPLSKPGVAQPFSSEGVKAEAPALAPSASSAPKVVSSVPAGTVLKGLNFLKDKSDPIALADDEYPAWLWRVLDKKAGDASAGGAGAVDEGDLYAKSKKQRQRAAKALRKRAALNPESLAPKVPVYEQSVDLRGGEVGGGLESAKEAVDARAQLNKAMRDKRRKGIKEDNFLRAMG